jgi:prepilin-type N-terminal cleavage/methylation domain-containing protein
MRTAGNKAFTLVELLMVIMIISLLSTMLVPAVTRAIALARRAACRGNIRGIVQGLKGYSNVSEEMPKVPVLGWDVEVGTNRMDSPFREPGDTQSPGLVNRNHSANLWLLVRDEQAPMPAFICPGSVTDMISENQDIQETWDFESGENISYGLQSPYGFDGSLTVLSPSDVVLVADGSPYTTVGGMIGSATIIDWTSGDAGGEEGSDGISEAMRLGNSPNHAREGQNVGYIDGRVEWMPGGNCGKDGDNIYTARGQTVQQDKIDADAEVLKSGAGNLVDKIRNNENDTLILP